VSNADSLNDLAEFIKVTNVGMSRVVKDYNGLVEVREERVP
jgi:hypothetical protein